jgi:glycosyltransferase involved in cell wall biosynthesis
MIPKVSVITATTGRKELARCVESVGNQLRRIDSPFDIQHLVFVDGSDARDRVMDIPFSHPVDIINLPYQVGNDRWNGHRMYGAGCYLADGDYLIFLDDDNYLDSMHIQNCLDVMARGCQWTYSLRKIVSVDGEYLCNDDCESLGLWASVIHPEDYFVDVNCYFLPRKIAVDISPVWYCRFREPGQPEIDRKICAILRKHFNVFDCTKEYSVNYAVASNSQLSVKPEFFTNGNAEMQRRYNGVLPWQQK